MAHRTREDIDEIDKRESPNGTGTAIKFDSARKALHEISGEAMEQPSHLFQTMFGEMAEQYQLVAGDQVDQRVLNAVKDVRAALLDFKDACHILQDECSIAATKAHLD